MNFLDEIASLKRAHRIIGRDTELLSAMIALKARRHLMIEGPVGVGKTVLATAVAEHLGSEVVRVDGDERYTEQKLSGWFDPAVVVKMGYSQDAFMPGPLTEAMRNGKVLFINELNRMPEGVQNILLPAMDEGLIEIPRLGTIRASPGFVIIATQNPREFVATTALSEALMDRFELLRLDYQPEVEETEIVRMRYPDVPEELVRNSVWITRRSRDHQNIRRGASIRAAMSMVELSAEMSYDMRVGLRAAAHMALPTRIELREESSLGVHEVIDEIVDECLSLDDGISARQSKGDRGTDVKGSPTPTSGKEINVSGLVPYIEKVSGSAIAPSDDIGWEVAKNYSRLRYMMPNQAMAEMARRIAVRATIRRVLQLLGPVTLPRMTVRTGYSFDDDGDIDIEATLDNSVDFSDIHSSDIIIERRTPRELAIGLMLDASLSMTGDKLAIATAAIAVIAHRLRSVDYMLITFNDRPRVIKKMTQSKELDDLISELLSFNAAGYTNIDKALHKGAEEFSRASTMNRVGILITDGNFTVGEDPRKAAMSYRRLFVIMTKSHDCQPAVCEGIAANGGGRMYSVSTFDEIPRVLYRVLRMVSQGAHASESL